MYFLHISLISGEKCIFLDFNVQQAKKLFFLLSEPIYSKYYWPYN